MPQPVPRSLFLRHVQGKRGANERTRTAYLTTLRVIYQALQEYAEACKSPISGGIYSQLCSVLHRIVFPVVPEWYQRENITCLLRLRESR